MKPKNTKRSNFIEYIAKRDGVIKNIESIANKPTTNKQTHMINKLVNQFPDIVKSNLYKTFLNDQTIGVASELITEIEENYFTKLNNTEEYIEYIAKRPRVIKEDSHGLFSSDDQKIILSSVKKEIKNHQGIIWTAIISLKREDANRLGYEDLQSWKILVRSQSNKLAENLRIDYQNFRWYGAFHNEAHHPHIHLVMYSADQKQGFLNKTSINNIRSSFAKEIFKHDLLNIYKKQTKYRDQLKLASDSYLKGQVNLINSLFKVDDQINLKLLKLSTIFKETSGKHSYGYLNKANKQLVDEIVNLVSNDKNIKKLLGLWYVQRNQILHTYSDKNERVKSLADIDAFRPVKNIVINTAKMIDTPKKADVIKSSNVIDNNNIPPTLKPNLNTITINNKTLSKLKSKGVIISDQFNDKQANVTNASIKLFYYVSKMIESSLLNNAQSYHADSELLKKIKRQKVLLGQSQED